MKDVSKVKKIISLATEIILLKDTLNEDEKELITSYVEYESSKKKYFDIIKKFKEV